MRVLIGALLLTVAYALENGLARTPPMGWMSWTAFYCEMDCVKHPHACINEQLYMDMADRIAADGYREAGYVSVHVDDCWMERERGRNGKLQSDRQRFPSGMQALARYVDYNEIARSCNLWRNFDDINSSWKSIMSIISYYDHNQDKHIPTHGPGQWHDPDMLVIGNPGITVDMAITQMSIWCIWSAPLIMSNDLRMIAPEMAAILQNREAISINQDPLGVMGRLVANTSDIGVYVKAVTPVDRDSRRTSFAVAILNRNEAHSQFVQFTLHDLGLKSATGYIVRNIWTQEEYGLMRPTDVFKATVRPTGTVLIRATLAGQAMGNLFPSGHFN